jgi:hypothetical protein
MSTTQFVIVALDPYESNEVDEVIGPFASEDEADDARAQILDLGAHPDAEWFVIPFTSFATVKARLQKEKDDLDDEESENEGCPDDDTDE